MFLIRWCRFCRGYLVVMISGQGVERFLNLALTRGIYFWDLQKSPRGAQLSIGLSSFRKVRPLVRKSRCRLHILKKIGLPFFMVRLRHRRGLVIGVLFFLAALNTLTSFIWFIEVSGNRLIPEEEILQLVEQLGVRPGIWKKKVNLFELEQDIACLHGGISWVGCRLKGTLLEIEIVEHLVEGESDVSPVDLIALKDGLVERVLVVEGQAAVKPGDTVSRGDLLIKGIRAYDGSFFPEEELPPPTAIRAKGEVEARVWYEARVPVDTKQRVRSESGDKQTGYTLKWPEGQLHLWGPRQDPYDISRREGCRYSMKWRNLALPLEVTQTRYYEIIIEVKEITPEKALEISRVEAARQVQDQLPAGVPIGETLCEEYTENGLKWVRAVIETRENIAVPDSKSP